MVIVEWGYDQITAVSCVLPQTTTSLPPCLRCRRHHVLFQVCLHRDFEAWYEVEYGTGSPTATAGSTNGDGDLYANAFSEASSLVLRLPSLLSPPPSSSSALPRLLPSTFFASETLYCHAGCAQLLQRPRLMQLLNHAACRSTAVAGAGPRWHLRQAFWAPRATRRRTRTSPPSSAHATLFENPKLASSCTGALHGSGTAQAAAIASGSCCRCCYCHRLPLPLPPSLLLLPLPPSLLLLLRRKRQW